MRGGFLNRARKFFLMLEEKAQISVEMIVIMAALVAVVLFFVTRMKNTVSQAADKMENATNDIWNQIDQISKE
ncbi:MAG: hypothetical protein DRO04_02160 [Candidatus Iainarchaeum archaeon]|uniref:Class III signal peptide-containing protein n=1 Tax=Candidatus Iainarchaeum sp. TaxID=3101447 RepID=A0A497JJV1_9ARCH|nr:MAG: hypothetical protein DRO04_02160 [Candidatus Diapherotrites archaeon]